MVIEYRCASLYERQVASRVMEAAAIEEEEIRLQEEEERQHKQVFTQRDK